MKKLLLIASMAAGFVTAPAFSATTFNVTISATGCDADGVCFMNITPAATVASGETACPNQNQVRWDGTTAEGKNFTASALTAKAADFTVNLGTVDSQCTGGMTDDVFPVVNFITVAG